MFRPVGKIPSLELPSWAVDENILNQIEALVLSVHENSDDTPDGRPDEPTRKVLESIDAMRHYIHHGIWQLDDGASGGT